MNCQRFMRHLGMDDHVAVIVQWLVRGGVGMVAFNVIQHVLAPTFGVTILSPSQLIDRFLAWNHTFPTPGTSPSPGAPPLPNPSTVVSPLLQVETLLSLLAWTIALWTSICLLASLWSWFEYGLALAGPEQTAAIDRGDR